mmetsp:Transcript_83119/g.114742  ORF Transcript_83119/g.114742 Transcript_83119/m.114742 type:complete len:218 (-) Transcript_83119:564-1217(-)
MDMIFVFFTVYYDNKRMRTVTCRKTIAKNYLKTWFFPDLLSIFPFDVFLSGGANFGDLFRFSKLGKLYKLVKMARLLKMVRLFKDRRKIVKSVDKLLKINAGMERLMFFIAFFLVFCHIFACLFAVCAQFFDDNWIVANDFDLLDSFSVYLIALYFTVTTVTTVGYGDIQPISLLERIFCIFLMLIGVVAFTFASGSLASILANYDSTQATMMERLL